MISLTGSVPITQDTVKAALSSLDGSQLAVLTGALTRRLQMAETFDGNRNVWESCGWPSVVNDKSYELRYKRFGIARQVVDAYPKYCWMKPPLVFENDDDKETEFEKAWAGLLEPHKIFTRLKQLDLMAGRGKFAILLVGIDDGKALSAEIDEGGTHNLLYLRPYLPWKVEVTETEKSPASPRFAMPVAYELRRKADDPAPIKVHWTRVVHFADETDDKDWEGTHRLESVWNHILDIEKIAGGGAEMFYKNGFPTTVYNIDKDLNPTTEEKAAMKTQIEEMLHGLTRSLRLRGVTPSQLLPALADPGPTFLMQVQLISAAKGIPQRVLLGSEQAQLASGQDSLNWLDRVETRRTEICEPWILRPFVDTLIRAGVLPPLPEGESIVVEWPELKNRTEQEEATVAKTVTETICKFAATPGAEGVMPLYHFLTEVLKWDEGKVEAVLDKLSEEEEDAKDDAAAVRGEEVVPAVVTQP